MENLRSNCNSHLTAKQRDRLSMPARFLLSNNLLKGEILDFGCGFGKDVEALKAKGLAIQGYDPYHFPKLPRNKFDTILCFYVLNVLMPEEQREVLMNVSHFLKPGGKAYFSVRRDIVNEGFRTHVLHGKPVYQCNVKLPYKSIFLNQNCEIYEYQHFNQIKRQTTYKCPFCNPEPERQLIFESATAYSIYDKYPVNNGHALIIPKRHCMDYFELTFKEQSACFFMVNMVKDIITKQFKPDGFNIGVNVGEKAGQTIQHAHIHLIPRFSGDVSDPFGGIRGVLPNKKHY